MGAHKSKLNQRAIEELSYKTKCTYVFSGIPGAKVMFAFLTLNTVGV